MDKVTQYQQYIQKIFDQYASYHKPDEPIQPHFFINEPEKRYCAVDLGWQANGFVNSLVFHFDIINEKIWLQANWTDWDVTEDLMEMGVPKSDIVLGFLPEDIRGDEGFGVG